MSMGSLWDAAAPAALAVGVSVVSILQAGDWARVSTPARHYISTYITTGRSHLSCTAVKPDSNLAWIFCQNCFCIIYCKLVLIRQTDFHAPKKSGLSGTHLYYRSALGICQHAVLGLSE